MEKTCCAAAGLPVVRFTPIALALAAMLAMGSPADAASIGHSRLVSAPGQPLHINVPIRELSHVEQQSLRVSVAPLAAWQQAGLTPPVQLSSIQVSVEEGFSPDARVIQVRSGQAFNGAVADLLIQINTSAGSQQHQVSLLADTSRTVPPTVGQSGASAASPSAALGVPSSSSSISVRRGDTLFALAHANAVDGVSVYQMMIALLKANPQAFINGNINLVKAGASLSIPDAAALRAVSDREARRIFQQHAQAFAEYRQGVAGRRGAAVTGRSAQSGSLSSTPDAVSVEPPAAVGDQVILSSGNPDDARADQQDATQRNIAESQTRVSQLERNVQSLNQALQMQGEAAKDAVLDGAAAVGQTLTEAATSIGLSSEEPAASEEGSSVSSDTEAGTSGAAGSGTSATTSAAGGSESNTSASQSGDGADSSPPAAQSADDSESKTSAQAAGGSLLNGQGVQTDPLGDASSNQDAAAGGQSGVAKPAATTASSTAIESQQGAGSTLPGSQPGSGAAGSASTDSGSGVAGPASGARQANGQSGSVGADASASEEPNTSTSSKAEQPVSWLQQNLLGVITAILALVVLVIAWVLRRASASRGGDGQGVVTEAMVQERLEKIDLDLSRSPDDGRPTQSG